MTTSAADAAHRDLMRRHLERAAPRFGVRVDGEPIWGWRDRSIGARVAGEHGHWWLRVVREPTAWAGGEFWTGNADAAAITGISKPTLVRYEDYTDQDAHMRAELMTYLPDGPCSPTPELRHPINLDQSWWQTLRRSLKRLAAWPTDRTCIDQPTVTRRLLAFYGPELDPTVADWATAHGDLHWANLTTPEFHLLDWEGWGTAPVGYDAATLYCYSLLVPGTAGWVHDLAADLLDTRTGRLAQLCVIARLLLRIESGDHLDLAGPLHHHARILLAALGR